MMMMMMMMTMMMPLVIQIVMIRMVKNKSDLEIKLCHLQGAGKEGIVRCGVADESSITPNVFFSRNIEEQALSDFEFGRAYAVRIEHTSVFDKAKNCCSIISYEKVYLFACLFDCFFCLLFVCCFVLLLLLFVCLFVYLPHHQRLFNRSMKSRGSTSRSSRCSQRTSSWSCGA